MFIGVDYYPEHWPRKRWKEDARLMKEAGFDVVRMGEFAWSRLEPEEGVYRFDWLDEVIDILSREGIRTLLGTPTASPPRWLTQKYPEILPVDEWGRRANPGGRRHYCLNSPLYWEYTGKIVEKLASHYKDHKEVIGWQIDNELGNPYCYCENCRKAFQKWLREKYKSLRSLNKRWGNAFWSQEFTSWEEIPLPSGFIPDGDHHPALKLEYRRFFSESNYRYAKIQVDILRKITPQKFITHNFLDPGPSPQRERFEKIDYYRFASLFDFISFDNYPWGEPARVAFNLDVMRGIGKGKFWILEQKSGGTNTGPFPEPGELRLWTHQAVARGAESIFYFRWRSCPSGQEQEHQGILDYDGVPGRRYREIKKTVEELRKIPFPLKCSSRVVLLHSYEVRWAFRASILPEEFDYLEHLMDFYRPFFEKGIPVDVIGAEEPELKNYKIVIAPSLLIIKDSTIEKLKDFVHSGGVLITTFFTGRKNWDGAVEERFIPQKLRETFGVEIEDYEREKKIAVFPERDFPQGKYLAQGWVEKLRIKDGAVSLAVYGEGWKRGKTCVSLNPYGKGFSIYIGARLNREFYFGLSEWLVKKFSLKPPPFSFPREVEIRELKGEKKAYFLLNWSREEKEIGIGFPARDIFSQKRVKGRIKLPPYGVQILSEI